MARALEEKHRLVSEYYQIPFLEAEQQPSADNSAGAVSSSSAGNESESDANRDAREVLLAALVQGTYDSVRIAFMDTFI